MKCLKEPLSRMANKQDNCKGTFFEARFKSIAILDEESLLTVAAYIDLNPVAAGMAPLPESSPHTSIKERVEHVIAAGKLENVEAIRNGSVAAQQVSEGIEDSCWLIPIEDQRSQGGKREGFKEGFTLGQYLMLVDCTSRTVRDDKQSVSSELESIFERLPPPGNIVERQYKGKMIRVIVLQEGFEYEGRRYKSLTAIAKEVSGSHCNGFLFFRLGRKA